LEIGGSDKPPQGLNGKSQVVNYTFPDPRYRLQVHVGIGFGTDIAEVRRVIVEAVRKVPGVLPDKPVDALYVEIGDSAMVFRVRWWIESYVNTRYMLDRVNSALQNALDDAGIEMPFTTYDVNLNAGPEAEGGVSRTPGLSSEDTSPSHDRGQPSQQQ
jgi:potassium efflux system protein